MSIAGVPASYVPNQAYTIGVVVRHVSQHRWGFELVPIFSNNMMAGALTSLTNFTKTQTVLSTGKTYISHTNQNGVDGTFAGVPDSAAWAFTWTAPGPGGGTVTFYAAGNAANGDNTSGGDKIYTTSASAMEGTSTAVDATTWGKIKTLYR